MACMKCGSAWKTRGGKDMVSCPDCCKQQRCKARKQGRIPANETKTCERCGGQFCAVGSAISSTRYCRDCRSHARSEYLRKYRKSVVPKTKEATPRKSRVAVSCGWCGKETKDPNQTKYCSRACFAKARKHGTQSWDRTNQLKSIWHRGGRWACAPSRKPIEEMRTNFTAFLAKVAREYSRVMTKPKACEVCGAKCYGPQARFCSSQCLGKSRRNVPCYKCGEACTINGVGKRKLCKSCRRLANKERNRIARRKYGRNHRDRARHHGVKYVAFPVRDIYERDGYRCQICSKRVFQKARYRKSDGKIHPLSPTIDHILAMSKGGNHEPSNCQTACFRCNSRKSDSGGGQMRLAIATTPPV